MAKAAVATDEDDRVNQGPLVHPEYVRVLFSKSKPDLREIDYNVEATKRLETMSRGPHARTHNQSFFKGLRRLDLNRKSAREPRSKK